MIFFWIALIATTVGALAGIGGGVIIKPILDFVGGYDVQTISFLSAVTVFSMATVSCIKYKKNNEKINKNQAIFLGIGGVLGGIVGEKVLNVLIAHMEEARIIVLQNLILLILMVGTFYYMNNKNKFKSYKVENITGFLIVGIVLGGVSSMLSIGGGPINICVLAMMFSMSTKEAAINSIIIILFSQTAKLATIIIEGKIPEVNYNILILMVLGGILGGIFGSTLNKNLKENKVLLVFNGTLIFLICINLLNIYNSMPVLKDLNKI
ncbi:MAG: TSUP family transporter [Clostridium sp.]|uniref:TSUP family transporter n=1 Tax=Clostridium sp. TaxID=1506 RepID=UPI003F3D8698